MGATAEQGTSDPWTDERPIHEVTLSTFSIGQTEVTQALWQAVMGSNPSHFTGNLNRPVEMVSWEDCQTFITQLNQMTGRNFRLPTEAEWEYAARGGKQSQGYKYAGSNDVSEVAWWDTNACDGVGTDSPDYGTHAVATLQANELGLYDMSGNVWEWCQDWYDRYSSDPQTNPTGPETGTQRVYRGGSWLNYARNCRVSSRYHWTMNGADNIGLRLAL
jgi:formylglycine-generating enzyme required for sulfatase activity